MCLINNLGVGFEKSHAVYSDLRETNAPNSYKDLLMDSSLYLLDSYIVRAQENRIPALQSRIHPAGSKVHRLAT